jgi:protein-glucosylgalactosylhydroxylysine glucosidase
MRISRRTLLAAGAFAGAARLWGGFANFPMVRADSGDSPSIDRRALVRRHNPTASKLNPFSALTVGNGNFAFTADVTGLQTFLDEYRTDFPLCTCSHWAWHTTPPPAGIRAEDFRYKNYDSHGRMVGYATDRKGQEVLFDWLRENPHRLHLGRIGFDLKADAFTPGKQTLDLWLGLLESQFQMDGKPVRVQSAVHPEVDALAARIESPGMSVRIAFPYASPEVDMADWNSPNRHETVCEIKNGSASFTRILDADFYFAGLAWTGGRLERTGRHEFLLRGDAGQPLDFVICFSPQPIARELPTVDQTFDASAKHWERFWTGGGAIDLSGSSDNRAGELERRIVLSQFNTALHCAAPLPPPETGLLFNSWYGKSHLEMHWWHGVHFAAWNRFDLFQRSLDFYRRIMPVAKATAQRQGYDGVRWPKMVGPLGRDSPSPIAPLLIWQQPHPIYFAEISYYSQPTSQTLEQWREIVFQSADFMASFAALEGDRYVLGPPLKPVPENTETILTKNPAFELAYWRFGLETAQVWRQRLGLDPDPRWADVLNRLAPLPQENGCYLMMEGMSDTYSKWNWEHPSMLGALGMQSGIGVDAEVMRATLKKVLDVWQWDRCWGWDFPMAAMTAAKLNEPELAVSALMIESVKNRYLPNGHVYQRPGLTAYLPANGGLLAATAMMANLSAFPRDGKWQVRAENLRPLL